MKDQNKTLKYNELKVTINLDCFNSQHFNSLFILLFENKIKSYNKES